MSDQTRRVLFVDSDRSAFEGLRSALQGRETAYEVTFAPAVDAAREALARDAFDAIILADTNPNGTNATVRAEAGVEAPRAVTVTATTAHEAGDLVYDVERACLMQDLLREEELRRSALSAGNLPSVPRIYAALVAKIEDPSSSAADVAAVLETDVAMSAKILQLINSAFYSLNRRIESVFEAVAYIGLGTLRSLVLSHAVFETFRPAREIPGFDIAELQRHSMVTARIAQHIAGRSAFAETAYTASLLHDVGLLVQAAQTPDHLAEAIARAEADNLPLQVVELDLFGVSHAEAGAYLLEVWGLPDGIVEAVIHHHWPARVEPKHLDGVTVVHVANALAREGLAATPERAEQAAAELDVDLLSRLGVADHVPFWREYAGREAGNAQALAA